MKSGNNQRSGGGFAKILRPVTTAFALFGGFCLIALMIVTVGDVVFRYIFNAPVRGAQDVSKLLLLATIFSAVPYCALLRGHVAIDLFVEGFGPRTRKVLAAIIAIPGIVILAALGGHSINAAALAAMLGTATNLLFIPFAPFHWLIAASAFLWAIVLAGDIAAIWSPDE